MTQMQQDMPSLAVDRRQFIAGSVATFLVPVMLSLSTKGAQAATTGVGAYIKIDDANIVTLIAGQTEMGQGIGTGLAQIMAEELMLDWTQVRFEHAPLDPATYGLNFGYGPIQITGGSTSTLYWYQPLRIAAAKAAYRLKAAAALKLGSGSAADWHFVVGGKITNNSTTYLFKDVLAQIGSTADPDSVSPVTTKRIIGQGVRRLDIASKVNGTAVFGMDVKLPNMAFASVIHCPTITGMVKSAPTSATGALKVVNLGDSVGVVAINTYAAMKAANAISSQITWNYPANLLLLDSASLATSAQNLQDAAYPATLFVAETSGTPDANLGTLDAIYKTPFLAHACMEVMNCTATVTMSTPPVVEIWAPTQGQSFVTGAVQSISGLSSATVKVNTMLCGGGFGRKIE